jgi:hypothetical protein
MMKETSVTVLILLFRILLTTHEAAAASAESFDYCCTSSPLHRPGANNFFLLLSKESYFTDDSEMLSALFYYKFVQSERIPFVHTVVHTVSTCCHEAESCQTEETYGQIVKQQAIERPAVSCNYQVLMNVKFFCFGSALLQ